MVLVIIEAWNPKSQTLLQAPKPLSPEACCSPRQSRAAQHAPDAFRELGVKPHNRARMAWTLFGVPYILHVLSVAGYGDEEWFYVAEDSCYLFEGTQPEDARTRFRRMLDKDCFYQLAYRRIASAKKRQVVHSLTTTRIVSIRKPPYVSYSPNSLKGVI